jgi:hypothetical protein
VNVLDSTSTHGPRDLDLRPAELERSTIWSWVQRCNWCGYCAANIAGVTQLPADAVERDEYRAQLVDADFPDLANSFLCSALLAEQLGRTDDAALDIISAAWVCDDEGSPEAAVRCRLRAVELLRGSEGGAPFGNAETKHVVIVDLLRRAGQFDEAVAEADTALADATGAVAEILAFSRARALAGDVQTYTVKDAQATHDESSV